MDLPLAGDPDELALQRAGFAAMLRGEVLAPTELGSRAGLDNHRADEAFAKLRERGSVTATDDGRVDGIAGVTVRRTRHQLTGVIGGQEQPVLLLRSQNGDISLQVNDGGM